MINKKLILSLASLLFLIYPHSLFANNLAVSSGSLTAQDNISDTIKVQFDISWQNSWRDAINHDAAWVFVKYSTDSGDTWQHATLKSAGTNPANFSIGTGTTIQIVVPSDKKGCFLERAETGQGTLSTQGAQLVWDYGTDGVSDADANGLNTRIRIFAVEMVYIPEGSFLAGEYNADKAACFKAGQAQNIPVSINSENVMVFNNAAMGPYYYQSASNSGEFSSGDTFTVSSGFPKGYKAFYLMKYEISQGQWINFFNTLTDSQKITRDITSSSGKNTDGVMNRNAVSWTSGDATLANSREQDRACNFLSWMDLCAFADWAGLRPTTELEFEKSARGTTSAVDNEYAWGDSNIVAASSISGSENGTETITTSGANACYNGITFSGGDAGTGPLRCGIFASESSTRSDAGAGYYGNMELSGNLWERCVSVGNTTGLNFTGTQGDGTLASSGNATNTDWPGIDSTPSNGVTGAAGSGFRGGSWYDTTTDRLAVADRNSAALADSSRDARYGGRCVRTAP